MMIVKRVLIAFISILIAVVVAIKGKSLLQERTKEKLNMSKPKSVPISVELFYPKEGSLTKKLTALGEIKSQKEVAISTKLAGFIKVVNVTETQKVKSGDILVLIDSKEIESSLKSLNSSLSARESSLEYAREVYSRNSNLYSVGGISKEILDKSMIELKSQEALLQSIKEQIAQLKIKLSYLNIKAPFDGVVDRVFLHEGDIAVTNKPILKISDGSQKLIFTFNPMKIDSIKSGERVYLKGTDKVIGKVKTVYTSSSLGLAQAEVSLIESLDMPTGVNIGIEVEIESKRGCILSSSTTLQKKDGLYVMLYKNREFLPKKIEPLIESGDKILIESCPNYPLAKASKSRLATLPSYKNVLVSEDKR
jgi:RND family efflux transporter MFP subunit